MIRDDKMSDQDVTICDAVIDKGWCFAVLNSINDNEEIKGMIIGDIKYVEYITKHLDENYTIITGKDSLEHKNVNNG